jgi:hypothetical protein
MSKTMKMNELPELATIATSMGTARDRLVDLATRYDRESLTDRLWIGVCCLAAQERHAIEAPGKRNPSGKNQHAKEATSRRDMAEISPNEVHAQGFAGWLAAVTPWLNRATAYKYMDAARGAGMTALTTEEQCRLWTGEMLGRDKELSLAALVNAGRKLLPTAPKEPAIKDAERWQQMTFDSLIGFGAQTEQVIACRPHMTPKQVRLAAARAYQALRELTGSPWAPSDADDEDILRDLEEARRGGL